MNFKENTFYNSMNSINQKIIILIHKDFELNVLDEEGRSLSKAIKTILLMILRLGVISMCIHVCIIRIPYFLIQFPPLNSFRTFLYCDLWSSKFKKEQFPRKLYEEIRYAYLYYDFDQSFIFTYHSVQKQLVIKFYCPGLISLFLIHTSKYIRKFEISQEIFAKIQTLSILKKIQRILYNKHAKEN